MLFRSIEKEIEFGVPYILPLKKCYIIQNKSSSNIYIDYKKLMDEFIIIDIAKFEKYNTYKLGKNF